MKVFFVLDEVVIHWK